MSKFIGQIKPPCGIKCELRGTEVCHTDKCPKGWKEYQEKIKARREKAFEEKKRSYPS